ncbi:hypothetical protein JCM11641_006392 [Rhodosporidiobolus odoratus]
MPALLGRQADSTANSATPTSTVNRFLPSSTSTSDSNTDSDNGNGDTKSQLWKYAIFVILAVLALFLLIRLAFIYRLRRQGLLLFQQAQNEAHATRHERTEQVRAEREERTRQRRRRDSLDTLDDEVTAPPAYDDFDPPPPPTPPSGPQEQVPPRAPPRFPLLSRLFHRSATASSSSSPIGLHFLNGSSTSRAPRLNPPLSPNRNSRLGGTRRTSTETEAIRRALNDAGLLVIPPSLALRNSSTSHAPSPSPASVPGQPPTRRREETEEEFLSRRRQEREERRARRRVRRRERREREEEGFGLPTYSKKTAEGEETLQRGEGWKEEDERSSDEGESGAESEAEETAVLTQLGRDAAVQREREDSEAGPAGPAQAPSSASQA